MKLAQLPKNIEDFEGEWRLDRTIVDQLSGQTSHLIGRAVFTRTAPALLGYFEEGRLRLEDASEMQATRRYSWAFDDKLVSVSFPEGGFFHQFNLAAESRGSDHLCGADLYKSTYDFAHWPRWTCRWAVTGPRKSYQMVSEYTR